MNNFCQSAQTSFVFDEEQMLRGIDEYHRERREQRAALVLAEEIDREFERCCALASGRDMPVIAKKPRSRMSVMPAAPSCAYRAIDCVCDELAITRQQLFSINKKPSQVWKRFLTYEILKCLGLTTTRIGSIFSQHHTSIVHGQKRAKVLQRTDPQFRGLLERILTQLSEADAVGLLEEAA